MSESEQKGSGNCDRGEIDPALARFLDPALAGYAATEALALSIIAIFSEYREKSSSKGDEMLKARRDAINEIAQVMNYSTEKAEQVFKQLAGYAFSRIKQ